MIVKRKYYSNSDKKNEERKEELLNKGIVSGTVLSGFGGLGLAITKKLEKDGIKDAKSRKYRALSKFILPAGIAIAGVSGYKKYKKNRSKNDNKA